MIKKTIKWALIMVLAIAALLALTYYLLFRPEPPAISSGDRALLTLIPLPQAASITGDPFEVGSLVPTWTQHHEERLDMALGRLAARLSNHGPTIGITISCTEPSAAVQHFNEDESYNLTVNQEEVLVSAPTALGVLHGLETLQQLAMTKDNKTYLPSIEIRDFPRFPWRGLMIDVGRHWISKESILRTLTLMAAAKLNVLHLHLSEYQGFRVESKVYPKLHELGSGGNYYRQEDIREIVAFARDLGIRVVPEFDIPGHATSWLVGYPELASAPGPYKLETKFGVFNPVLDPTREEVYSFLDGLIGEMSQLFPDTYFHIGGDEVASHDWDNNSAIAEFMKQKGLADAHDLQHYFNQRVQALLAKYGKKPAGWDEILDSALVEGTVVQAWRSQKALFETVRMKHYGILSNGWYLDHKLHADRHYQVDPTVLPGAVTIEPDSLHWSEYALQIKVSGSAIPMRMVLYGRPEVLRGLFDFNGQMTGFDNATLEGADLRLTFKSDYGDIDVDGSLSSDSISGTMSLGIISFPFQGRLTGGSEVSGTVPPKVEKVKPLSGEEENRILGGEAAMWTEVVDDYNLDSRLWPRTLAVAERLWSSKALAFDAVDFYRRLDQTSSYLTIRGSLHTVNYRNALARLAEEEYFKPVKTLIDILEEVKYYDRLSFIRDTSVLVPLDRVADVARPESEEARQFNRLMSEFLLNPRESDKYGEVVGLLDSLVTNHGYFLDAARGNERLEEILPFSMYLSEACYAASDIVKALKAGQSPDPAMVDQLDYYLQDVEQPLAGVMVAIVPGLRELWGWASR